MSHSQQAFSVLTNFLEQRQWQYEDRPGLKYRFEVTGNHLHMICFASIKENLEQLHVFALSPIKTPENRRMAIMELVTRINFATYIGNFELDFEDGEIRFKSSVSFAEDQLTPELLRNTVDLALDTLDHYWPLFAQVMDTEKTAESVLQNTTLLTDPILFEGTQVKFGDRVSVAPPFDASAPTTPGVQGHSNVVEFLFLNDWNPSPLDDKYGTWTTFGGNNVNLLVYTYVQQDSEKFMSYAIAPESVPKAQRQAMMELITRINFGLYLGNFDMNVANGELRYRTGVWFKDVSLSKALIKMPMYLGVMIMDKYWPAFQDVMTGTGSVADAMEVIGSLT